MRTHDLHVFYNNKLIVIETNLDFAIPYWKKRILRDPKLKTKLVEK